MLKAAIVGLGWWGRTLVDAVQDTPVPLAFTRAVTLDPEQAAPFAEAHGLRLGSRYEDVLADPAIDAVVLATPHTLHVPQIVAAAQAGKAVFCEKPLAFSVAQARLAIDACARAGVVLGLGHDKRWIAPLRALQTLLDEGRLGELLHLEGQYSNDFSSQGLTGAWRESPDETPAGGLTGPGLHVLDALVALGGPMRRVAGTIHRYACGPRPVDAVGLLAEFRSGAIGLVSSVRAVPELFRLQVCGTGGWAEIRGFDRLVVSLRGEPVREHGHPGGDAVRAALHAFARAVLDGTPFPIAPTAMLQTVAALEASLDALRQRCWIDVADAAGTARASTSTSTSTSKEIPA